MITNNSPSVGDMEEGTYMEKAIWTWRESRGSAKLTFGFNFIVLFTVFQLFLLDEKGTYHQYREASRYIIFRYFLPVELNPSAEQESWTRSEDHSPGRTGPSWRPAEPYIVWNISSFHLPGTKEVRMWTLWWSKN